MNATRFMKPKSIMRRADTNSARIRGGKLVPVLAQHFGQSESGVMRQTISMELDAIPGRVLTPMYMEVVSIFCPLAAMVKAKNPESETAHLSEVLRKAFIAQHHIFDLEDEGDISKACGIVPMSLAGNLKVSERLRLAHNVAVNFMRRRRYVDAALIDEKNNTSITPALLGSTILDRLNAVLDPEDRVNGAVNLTGKIRVEGISLPDSPNYQQTGMTRYPGGIRGTGSKSQGNDPIYIDEDMENPGYPGIFANLADSDAISISDFEAAQTQDELSRWMRSILEANPEHGEEILARVAYGLKVDNNDIPVVLYRRRVQIGADMLRAMDGPSIENEITQTNGGVSISFTAAVPQTEFGGVAMTFVTLKPDEAFVTQPHPDFTEVTTGHNFPADLLAIDPVPVLAREVDSDVATIDEDKVVMYVGNNQLKRNYSRYGYARDLDTTEVARKSSIWQYKIPTSVSPGSIIYPENIDHYVFADHAPNSNVATVTATCNLTKTSPIIFGPTPIEEMPIIEDENLFGDA